MYEVHVKAYLIEVAPDVEYFDSRNSFTGSSSVVYEGDGALSA